MSMLTALIRVAARAAEIQLEEVAASAALRTAAKGKGRATLQDVEQLREDLSGDRRSSTVKLHEDGAKNGLKSSSLLDRPDLWTTPYPFSAAGPSARSTSIASEQDAFGPTHTGRSTDRSGHLTSEVNAVSPAQDIPSLPLEPAETLLSTPGSGTSMRPNSSPKTSPTLQQSVSSHGVELPAGAAVGEPTAKTYTETPTSSQQELETQALGGASAKVTMDDQDDEVPLVLRASKVPSSRIGRLLHYGSLAASMSLGAATESLRRNTGGNASKGSVFMSDANIRRLVASLGRMRGAALKLGQFMSIQDNHLLPPEIEQVLQQVQAHANYMPDWQMEQVISSELGPAWQSLFSSFDRTPIASASIGQVHRATLASTGQDVAVKIQFPGIASSIHSDLNNLSILLRTSSLLPKGMYLQNTIAVMRRELEDECDYVREGAAGKRFSDLLENDDFFTVPKVVDEATTGKVLTTEWAKGRPLSRMKGMSQATRDKIGENILRLCLQELFQFRFMQTDPNWANFLYDPSNDKITLIDFGASREYTKDFMDGWYRLLTAGLRGDRVAMKVESESLGYLTGEENDDMLKAHLDSMALIASPFSTTGPYPFAKQTITDSVRALIPIMLRHRLTPPPPETYSLNRKLSGAFLMCAKLGANVDCGKLWEDHVGNYQQG